MKNEPYVSLSCSSSSLLHARPLIPQPGKKKKKKMGLTSKKPFFSFFCFVQKMLAFLNSIPREGFSRIESTKNGNMIILSSSLQD